MAVISFTQAQADKVLAAHFEDFTSSKLNCLSSLSYGLPSTLDKRVDEVVERWAILLKRQYDVAPDGELQAIGVNTADEIIFFLFRFPSL